MASRMPAPPIHDIPDARVYRVGGAVRDKWLGLPVKDNDWVVVGATPEQMLAQGFLPVGKDFPVFLHPVSKEEYALARTERKTAHGYTGFAVHAAASVTLEEDLARRDLTINAIAESTDGELHDPYNGLHDLQDKILRHVTSAFAEDPVRILRVARFAARFADFSVAPETLHLMQRMVAAGETDHLVPERAWQEISRGLMEQRPSRMLAVLRECGALAHVLPEVDALFGIAQPCEHHPEIDTGEHLLLVLDMASRLQAPLAVRYACLCHDLGKATTPVHLLPRHVGHERSSATLLLTMSRRLRVPNECRELAHIVALEHGNIHRSSTFGAAATVRLLERCDAFRQPQRFARILLACECDARGRKGMHDLPYPQRERLWQALQVLQQMDLGAIAQQAATQNAVTLDGHAPQPDGARIRQHIHQARIAKLQASCQSFAQDASQ